MSAMGGRYLTDGQARRIASEWHGGQWSALYSLASTGYVARDVMSEISREVQQLPIGEDRRELLALDKYARARLRDGLTSTVEGWSRLWDDTAATLDQC